MSMPDRPIIKLDVAQYQKYLDHSDISDEEKQELLEILWDIVTEAVSLGFGVHPLQQVQESNLKKDKDTANPSLLSPDMIELRNLKLSKHFTQKARSEDDASKKESQNEKKK